MKWHTFFAPPGSLYRTVGSLAPSSTGTPVSSCTSRTAHSGNGSSLLSSLPFGQDQSSYRGRWISSTSRRRPTTRHTTAPAASTSRRDLPISAVREAAAERGHQGLVQIHQPAPVIIEIVPQTGRASCRERV